MTEIVSEIPRAYTALAEWGSCLMFVSMLPRKRSGPGLFLLAAGSLAVQTAFMTGTGNLPVGLWIPCMMIAVLMMFAFLFFTCKGSLPDIVCVCARAFILAELIASLERQVYWFFWPNDDAPPAGKIVLLLGIYGMVLFLVRALEHRHIADVEKLNIAGKELLGVILVALGVFFISNISFATGNTPFSSRYPREIAIFRTLTDAGGYVILYAHYVLCCQARIRKELDAMRRILQNQYAQYKHSRDSIEHFNRIYHDLKHQLNALRAEYDPGKKDAWADVIMDDIKEYDVRSKTGNPVLDVILTGKQLYCNRHGISLTCVADGALLAFMNVRDVCTIFGNALDNAIESVRKIPDKEKRLIHVSVFKRKKFIMFRFENCYEGELRYESGLPVTTKEDADYHGYGLKSIRTAVRRYGGNASVHAQDGWFELDCIFPSAQEPSPSGVTH
ncbi:MAG: GHKL domain-containing protein [Clostridiales Family XIII bacterium]|jgi:hypothetical protein|nr:GHKL domain-containing protein [Clostridiales Family XIII bacterium]